MSKRHFISQPVQHLTLASFDAELSLLQRYGFLSRNQTTNILKRAAAHPWPCIASVEQRDKKGATYVQIGAHHYRINNRAEVFAG
jgi:hypothetical protein